MRTRLFARLEPLVPGGLPGVRTGDLLSRFVADVDELQNLWLWCLSISGITAACGNRLLSSVWQVGPGHFE